MVYDKLDCLSFLQVSDGKAVSSLKEVPMPRLVVRNFSAIKHADITLSALTVVIGPQASGKSILSKLAYFSYSTLPGIFPAIEEGGSYSAFRKRTAAEFCRWFPPSAWGKNFFSITFYAGDFVLSIRRRKTARTRDQVNVQFSPYIQKQYGLLARATEARFKVSRAARREHPGTRSLMEYSWFWRIRHQWERRLARQLGSEYVGFQLLVPAGRAFFTTIGKAVAVFERGETLDPATIEFGRFFANTKEVYQFRKPSLQEALTTKAIFGGEIRIERDREYVHTSDGRVVPFHALSSGQQELLPLLLTLGWLKEGYERDQQLIYIEEPEAHLFPSAQATITEMLASVTKDRNVSARLFITTHSPYLMAKLNNCLKAGMIASRYGRKIYPSIREIIDESAWLEPGRVYAYAIVDGVVRSIIGRDSLIDAAYLDDVSGDISDEFLAILGVETEYEDRSLSKEHKGPNNRGRRK